MFFLVQALTRAAERIVREFETDQSSPSTFWCPQPDNEWVGNIAAGSEAFGFWFELRDNVRPPTALLPFSDGMVPTKTALRLFVDNVAHSNRRSGVRTYPFGMYRDKAAV